MGLTTFERESFVFICIFFTSICTSKGSEIQRFQNFRNVLRGKVGRFKRYRNGTNGIRKKIICTRLYLKEFGDTVYFLLREKIWNCFFYFHFYTENSFLCKIVFIFLCKIIFSVKRAENAFSAKGLQLKNRFLRISRAPKSANNFPSENDLFSHSETSLLREKGKK